MDIDTRKNRTRRMALLFCMVLMPVVGASTLAHAGEDEAGSGTGLDKPAATHAAVVSLLTERFRLTTGNAERIVDAVEQAAGKLKLPPSLILAIIQTESSFNPHATSSAGALGLMQVMPATRRDIAPDEPMHGDIFEPARNIYVGTSILRRYLDQAGGNMDRALYRYSGGMRGYVKRVSARQRFFDDFGEPEPRAPVTIEPGVSKNRDPLPSGASFASRDAPSGS